MNFIDVRTYGALGDGSTNDIAAINQCLQENKRVLINNGIFIINSSIIIPSNTHLYLKNCIVKLGNGCFDNVIRNQNQSGDTNIRVIGLGNVELNQNAANNNDTISRTTYGESSTLSWKYLCVFMCNVDNFQLKNYKVNDYCAWSHLIQRCSNGVIDNIWINQSTVIQTQDGIDIGHGSHDITVSNIYGRSGDDFIAIVSWSGGSFVNRSYMSGHTYNLTFTNIYPYYINVANCCRILAGDGGKITDIDFSSLKCNSTAHNWLIVGSDLYPATPPVNADIKDITIDIGYIKTIGTPTDKVISLISSCSNIFITNLVNDSGKALIETSRTPANIWVNGTQYY